MHNKLKMAVNIAMIEFKRWMKNPKLIIVPVLLTFIRNLITGPLVDAGKET